MFLGKDDPEAAAKDDSTSVETSEMRKNRTKPKGMEAWRGRAPGSGPSRIITTLDSGDLHHKATADITLPAVV